MNTLAPLKDIYKHIMGQRKDGVNNILFRGSFHSKNACG